MLVVEATLMDTNLILELLRRLWCCYMEKL